MNGAVGSVTNKEGREYTRRHPRPLYLRLQNQHGLIVACYFNTLSLKVIDCAAFGGRKTKDQTQCQFHK